jgi:hypothetical protein
MKVHEILDEEIMNELTFYGSKCKDFCGGHRAGFLWARLKQLTDVDKCSTKSPSFNNGCRINIQQRAKGINVIGPTIRGEKGRFQKFQPRKK